MQYSPKLKKAMDEIKKVLEKHDIAGVIVLHAPGFTEYLMSISPSYSCAKLEGDQLRVQARLEQDFQGKRDAQLFKIENTSNMMYMLADTTGSLSLTLMEMSDLIDDKTGARHNLKGHTTDTTQNN